MPVRRSLQTPDPDEPYLTKGHDVIDIIKEALARDKKGKGDILRMKAMEIGDAWDHKDDTSCIRLALFGYKILLLVWPHHKLINRGFLSLKIEELNRLKGKLVRGVNPSRRERKFVKALRGSLYDEWLEAIRGQAKRVLEKTEPL
ncbi:hypothetical protein FOVG_16342 [Fusarium oxysporum f. sp. pisi HDV247]|uniref:Uncharacterized protein n=1 Tax=Fusarium oxysporum f. sp. pisi HDV247 TaxID=1080344 RepID=W9NNX0_FUSOX|nr:hypothetical protein FOVG_16342 [Fusarium oxysporum f. sp. pisi HDV247]